MKSFIAPDGYDCAYCPLGGVGEPVMVDGHPAHPDCADAVYGESADVLSGIRALVLDALGAESPEDGGS